MQNVILPSLIGIGGVIIGSLLSSFNNLRIKSKETKLRIIEKVIDKRIQAHENILALVINVRTVVSIGQTDEQSNVIGYPSSLESEDDFLSFLHETFFTIHRNSHWLNTNLERELGFLQDYLISLNKKIKGLPNENVQKIGLIVKQDFIDLAKSLENLTFEFFRADIYTLKINKHNEWHKHPREVTSQRLNETNLFTKHEEIEVIRNDF